ncbi:MAG: hypothetical protein AAB365_01095 [Patescibacteria group bacterium]
MNTTKESWFEITWYLGFFCVIKVRPPEDSELFEDEEEQLTTAPAPVHRAGRDRAFFAPQPSFMWRFA